MSATKATHPDERSIDEARAKGRSAAKEPYASALIPPEYWKKQDLANAWYNGFMDGVKK